MDYTHCSIRLILSSDTERKQFSDYSLIPFKQQSWLDEISWFDRRGKPQFLWNDWRCFKTGLIFLWSWLQKPKFRTQLFTTGHPNCFSRQAIRLRVFTQSVKQTSGSPYHTLKIGKDLWVRPSRTWPLKIMLFRPADIKMPVKLNTFAKSCNMGIFNLWSYLYKLFHPRSKTKWKQASSLL